MVMQLLSITDPRDNLEKARRSELVAFAAANGVKEINADMPAILIRKVLRSRGLTRITIPSRRLGQVGESLKDMTPSAPAAEENVQEIGADEDLARQFGFAPPASEPQPQSQPEPPKREAPKKFQELARLRKLSKEHGIKVERTDNLITLRHKLREKLGGEIPS